MFVAYALGNIYYTLLSRITIPAAEMEARIARFFVRTVNETALATSTAAVSDQLQSGTKIEAKMEEEILPILDASSAFYAQSLNALNVLLYLPMGYLLPCVFPKLRNKPWLTILIVFLISRATETLQGITNLGQFDVRDLLCNTLGALIGLAIYKVGIKGLSLICKAVQIEILQINAQYSMFISRQRGAYECRN